jgi:DNA mismatch repair ATPase MutS
MREVCAVITRGTMIDGDMTHMNGERMVMLSLVENTSESGSSLIGLCVVDASTGCFQLCQVPRPSFFPVLLNVAAIPTFVVNLFNHSDVYMLVLSCLEIIERLC